MTPLLPSLLPGYLLASHAQHVAKLQRLRDLKRAQGSLFWLATEVLGYDKLTVEFHKPILDDWDRKRRDGVTRELELWPRGHYKTTCRIAQIVQDLLIDPDDTILVSHAVEDEVSKIVKEVGEHFWKNDKLRRLCPDSVPPKNTKNFVKALNFTLKRTKFSRQPSVMGKSANSEITGAHVNRVYPDDIIGRNTIEDSGLPKVKRWFRNTVMPVLNPGGTIRATGTRWDLDDIYADWLKNKRWSCRVRAAYEVDGKPDPKGEPILFTQRQLQAIYADMGASDFAFQYMNDPSPPGEKPWDADACEHWLDRGRLEGTFIILSDPAPAKVGSWTGVGEKQRADGSKDFWATCVVCLRRRGQRNEIILVDGQASQSWGPDEGLEVICDFLRRYPGAYVYIEAYGGLGKDYERDMRNAARDNGVRMRWLPFKGAYAAKAKNLRFAKLADKAKDDEFLMSRGCPTDFVEQFLEQARGWRPLPNGRNTNKWDDCADVVAMATMEGVTAFRPTRDSAVSAHPWPWFKRDRAPEYSWGTRHVKV